ncbi:MAG: carbon starvation CstA family protein [Thermodesulfobacteriota bacterium]|nr:carbon starvation CstA family protein [Thermodesulfobacteriota bacterium]
MKGFILLLIGIVSFIIAYRIYGRYLEKLLDINPDRKTPAVEMEDGMHYVPTHRLVLFGHHFAGISGAGPIIGPTLALVFGWLPAFLWLLFGNIFLGIVQDFTSMVLSVRQKGRTIADSTKEVLNPLSRWFFALFVFLLMISAFAVFVIIISRSWVSVPQATTPSIAFIFIAVLIGYLLYKAKMALPWATIIGVVLFLAAIIIGMQYPIVSSYRTWMIVLFGYSFIAAALPIWILLQPRDYLNTWIMIVGLVIAAIGAFIGLTDINFPAFSGWTHAKFGPIFPMLMIVMACGAISGGHTLITSATTSKQIKNERDIRPVAIGAMQAEGILALVVIVGVASLGFTEYNGLIGGEKQGLAFAMGFGGLISHVGIPLKIAMGIAILLLSCFIMTTLDTVARIAGLLFNEITGLPYIVCVAISVVLSLSVAWGGRVMEIWPLFGAANQLIGGLALLVIIAWIASLKKSVKSVTGPLIFMWTAPVIGLILLSVKFYIDGNVFLLGFSAVFVLIAVYLAYATFVALRRKEEVPA